jgi:PPK2 family polyphosphate:nucleotide phosphotransferase
MKLPPAVVEELTVRPGTAAGLTTRDTKGTAADWLGPIGKQKSKEVAGRDLKVFRDELQSAQELLYASDAWAVLVVVQGLDAAGKDGTIKHVMSGVDPQGCQVVAFKEPSAEELRHDFLWRCAKALPERGQIGIFNRSYYEEVLVVRVHPALLDAEHLPPESASGDRLWQERFEDINAFERHLVRNGTQVVKLFLHVSKEEQRRRLLRRLDDPAKQWKFAPSDLTERAYFDSYQDAYETMLSATSTPWAPWHVVPADHKLAMRALVGGIVVDAIDRLDLRIPAIGGEQAAMLDQARHALEAESG